MDREAQVVDAGDLGAGDRLAGATGEELEEGVVGDPEVDDPGLALPVEEPEDLGEAQLLIEGERTTEVVDLDGDMAEAVENLRQGYLLRPGGPDHRFRRKAPRRGGWPGGASWSQS